jgi:hypothetical protein
VDRQRQRQQSTAAAIGSFSSGIAATSGLTVQATYNGSQQSSVLSASPPGSFNRTTNTPVPGGATLVVETVYTINIGSGTTVGSSVDVGNGVVLPVLVASVLPSARTTTIGNAVTAFATIINSGSATATACSISLPANVPANFLYQTTNPQTNTPTGSANTPVDIPAGQGQSFFFAVTPTASITQEIPLLFGCTNTEPASVVFGLNTFLVTAGSTPIPDMLSIAATLSNDGIADIPGTTGTGIMATAAINISVGGTVTVVPTPTPVGQPQRSLAANLTICQTNPSNGGCINPATPGSSSTVTVGTNQTVTFGIFIQGQGQTIPFDPANTRVFVLATQGANTVGEASVAVRTQ